MSTSDWPAALGPGDWLVHTKIFCTMSVNSSMAMGDVMAYLYPCSVKGLLIAAWFANILVEADGTQSLQG